MCSESRTATRRGYRPAPGEYQLHCAVADTVRRWIMPGWIYNPHRERREARSGHRG